MRIAVVSDYVDPENWGGASRVAVEQSLAMQELGHEICLIAASGSKALIPELNHKSWVRKGKLRAYINMRKKYVKYLGEFEPDLVILHQPLSASIVQKAFPDLKYYYHFNSSWAEEVQSRGKRFGLGQRVRMERKVLSQCEKIFVSCPFTHEVLNRAAPGVKGKVVEVGLAVKSPPFCVADSSSVSLRAEYNISNDVKILSTFRRLVPRTGIDLFIEVIAAMPNSFGFIGGVGESETLLRAKAKELNIEDRLIFLGYIEEKKMIRVLQGSDLAVVPSRELEGFGLFTVEALACGCPVAATPVGNNAHLLKSCGWDVMVASKTSAASLISCAENVLEKQFSPEDLNQTLLENYNWEKHARELLS